MTIDKAKVKRAWVTPQIVVFGALEEITKATIGPTKKFGPSDDFVNTDQHLS